MILCLLERFCYIHMGSFMQWHSSHRLARGWFTCPADRARSFTPDFFAAWGSPGRDPGRQVPWCVRPYQASACSLCWRPAGQGWSHGPSQNAGGRGTHKGMGIKSVANRGCCCEHPLSSLQQHCPSSAPREKGALKKTLTRECASCPSPH